MIRTLAATSAVLLLAACSNNASNTGSTIGNLTNGQPLVDDTVWLHNGAYQTSDPLTSDYLPPNCVPASPFPPASKTNTQINTCVEAMRNVIAKRTEHWIDGFGASINGGNTVVDLGVMAIGASGSIVGGFVSQIFNAITTALTGTKKTLDNDYLRNNSFELLVTQMKSDQACWATVIETRLDNYSYQTLDQGFNDLINYGRAGSFNEALIRLQSNVGAQANASTANLQSAKVTNGKTTTGNGTGASGGGSGGATGKVSANGSNSDSSSTSNQSTLLAASTVTTSCAGIVPTASPPPLSSAPQSQSWSIPFENEGQVILSDSAKAVVQTAATAILKDATIKVSIVGHADPTGTVAKNQTAADDRATAVQKQLVADKVPATSITSAMGDPTATPQARVAIIQQNPAPPAPASAK